MSKLLRLPDVQAKIGGLSRITIWRLERKGLFPKRRLVTPKIVVWVETEIDAWIQSRIQGHGYMPVNKHSTKGGSQKRTPKAA